jgi:hypothetical protein
MTSPKKSETARHFKLRYSRALLKIEFLLILLVYATLLIYHEQYDLVPSFVVVTLLVFIFFMRFSILARFPHGLRIEFRADPDSLICYHRGQEIYYPMKQVKARLTRWTVQLKLGRFPDTLHLALLQDSFEDSRHYTAFRRYLLERQE